MKKLSSYLKALFLVLILFLACMFLACSTKTSVVLSGEESDGVSSNIASDSCATLTADKIPIAFGDSTEFTNFRGGQTMNARVVGKGRIIGTPTADKYSASISTSETYFQVTVGEGNSQTAHSTNSVDKTAWDLEAYKNMPIDFGDGQVRQVNEDIEHRYFKLRDSDTNWYHVEVSDSATLARPGTQGGNTNKITVSRCNSSGELSTVYTAAMPVYNERPHVVIYDMTGNGVNDIVIVGWAGAAIFDPTAKSETEALVSWLPQTAEGWHKLRKRGFVTATDIDGSGKVAIVIIGCYMWHVDVLRWDGKNLKVAWSKIFDDDIDSAKKLTRAIINSVQDYDGDGKKEVVLNVWNDTGDGNWHVVGYDAVSGTVKFDLPGYFIHSAEDIDGDGKYEMFLTKTYGLSVVDKGEIAVARFNGRTAEILWTQDNAFWHKPRIYNTSRNTVTHSDGITFLAHDVVLTADMDGSGKKSFFTSVSNTDGTSTLIGHTLSGKSVKDGFTITVPAGMYGTIYRQKLGTNGRQNLLLKVDAAGLPDMTIFAKDATLVPNGRRITTKTSYKSVVAADIDKDGKAEIIVAMDTNEVGVFGINADDKLTERFRIPNAAGMAFQYNVDAFDFGVLAEDIDGCGKKEIIVRGQGERGAALFAYKYDGKLLWKHEFPHIHAGDITKYAGNIAFWNTAKTADQPVGRSVVVTVQRVTIHTGEVHILDGRTGEIIGKPYTSAISTMPGDDKRSGGFGGYLMTTCDVNGDGYDSIFGAYGNHMWQIDTNTPASNGAQHNVAWSRFLTGFFREKFDPYTQKRYGRWWLNTACPIPYRAGNGDIALFMAEAETVSGKASTKSGENLGSTTHIESGVTYDGREFSCLANIDGTGKLYVVEKNHYLGKSEPAYLNAYDPDNIEQGTFAEMTLPNKMERAMLVAADIDGCGRDEILVNDTKSRYGIRCFKFKPGTPKGTFEEIWQSPMPNGTIKPGGLSIADLDGDGFMEIVFVRTDGVITVLTPSGTINMASAAATSLSD